MANRGVYGQAEGNEARSATMVFTDHLRDNEICEGEWLAPMKRAAKQGDLREMGRLRDAMKRVYVKYGVPALLAQDRADSVLRQGMASLRI